SLAGPRQVEYRARCGPSAHRLRARTRCGDAPAFGRAIDTEHEMVVTRAPEHDSRGSPVSDQARIGRAARRRARLRHTLSTFRRICETRGGGRGPESGPI